MTTRTTILSSALAAGLFLIGCGEKPATTPDAGIDTSCGIDCDAQNKYGLIVNRCFEYTDQATDDIQSPPALGVLVSEVRELEGGVKVVTVDYKQAGIRRMRDNFILQDGTLKLARREFTSGGSVSYKDADGNITGVDWWQPGTAAGQNFQTTSMALVGDSSEETTYSVVTSEPTALEKKVPAGTFDNAVKMIFNENPAHGKDARRVFVEGTGFTLLTSTFDMSSGGTATEYRLQAIRDLGTADAGSGDCGLGP